ncbi:hypothetical protein F3J02_01650 [Acinetobacter sp. Tr-809]|uniref:hypothetical protein n=1 Tax=Acinetobacter sp. Tr-809 TaxID=2608324 RepID=UPI00142012F1|nr:hypothetical protein [Acinetobacter sp. Tr-809]NIE95197.1 hypothetical protein [Acinetobacter sp. Tr-809]
MTSTYIRKRPEISGRIYMRHLRTVDLCAKGSLKIFTEYYGMTNKEVSYFFANGMLIEEFVQRFGRDAMALKAIEFYESENGNGWKQ